MTVYVTGVGLVCPAGIGLEASLQTLSTAPPLGISDPEKDPDERLPARLQVPTEFAPKTYIKRRKDLKLMARANRLAVAAAVLAAEESDLLEADHAETGLFLAVGREPGNMDDILPAVRHSHLDGRIDLDRLTDEGVGWMNPLSSLKTLPNMSLAHVGIRLGIRGPSWTLCSEPDAGIRIVEEAVRRIDSGLVDRILVGGADSRTSFPDRVSAMREGVSGPVGEAGVFLMLESAQALEKRGVVPIASLEIDSQNVDPQPCPFGHCGAVTHMINMALAVGQQEEHAVGQLRITPIGSRLKAPSVHTRAPRTRVAITSAGLRTPLGSTFEGFSDALLNGVSAVSPIGAFDARRFPVKHACEVSGFDAEVELSELGRGSIIPSADRKLELGLAAALDALKGASEDNAPELIFGTGLSSVSFGELAQDCVPYLRDDAGFDYAGLAASVSTPSTHAPRRHQVARLIHLLQRQGLISTGACHFSACAAAAAAIGHGFDRVRGGLISQAVVGGCDSMVHPFGMIPFILLGATSTAAVPEMAGRPFDRDRDGFVMGEAGVFLRLEDGETARKEGREILGYVLGWGSSCDAHNVTAPHPEGLGAELAMRRALDDAGLKPADIHYINAHGTGTRLNDVIEAAAIQRVFGETSPPVSSSKGQFGHAIAAAGAIEALACLSAFRYGRLPPNAQLSRQDPEIHVDLVEREGRQGTPAAVMSNSFGFGGQNVSLILGHPGDLR